MQTELKDALLEAESIIDNTGDYQTAYTVLKRKVKEVAGITQAEINKELVDGDNLKPA